MGDIGQIIKILPPALADKLRLHTLSFGRLNELRLRVGRNHKKTGGKQKQSYRD